MAFTKQAKKHTGRAQKEQIVAELVEKLDNSSALVLADYQGLTHKQLEDLRKELKKLDSTIIVTKNSLIKISLGKSKNFGKFKDNEGLDRPTAALFIQDDYTQPLKELAKAIKNFGLPKIKFGILEGHLLDEAGVLKLASLPSKDTLLAQLAGTLNSPISGFVMTLNAPIQKFVMILHAIAQSKPLAESVAEQAPSEANQTIAQAESIEPAISANEPALQNDAPVESVETPQVSTETEAASTSYEAKSETNANDQNKIEGGEN